MYSYVPNGPGTVRCVETGCTIVDHPHAKGAHEAAHIERIQAGQRNAPPPDPVSVAAAQGVMLRRLAEENEKLRERLDAAESAVKSEQ